MLATVRLLSNLCGAGGLLAFVGGICAVHVQQSRQRPPTPRSRSEKAQERQP